MSLDFVSGMKKLERRLAEERLFNTSPDDAKYAKESRHIAAFISADAEWRMCARVQQVLLETRVEFGRASPRHLAEVNGAMYRISPLNMSLIEAEVTRHDQLAVIEEIGRFVSPKAKAVLHPGTTSYDILDTARSHLLKGAWRSVLRPKVVEVIHKLADLAEVYLGVLQVGRTHLKNTSPLPFGSMFAGDAARLANRVERCDHAFGDLRGKVSGIVGTGASIDLVIGEGRALDFERRVLEKLGLEPDYTATQIVQKERLVDVGNAVVTMMHVLADFAGDVRLLYSSAINEVVSRDSATRLGGSSTDAGKDNPINYENVVGKAAEVESGMRVLYDMINTDLQRDLCSSVQARYQPGQMIVQTYESFSRISRALDKISVNADVMARNLQPVRDSPTEAMTVITRAHGYIHPEQGVGHDVVKYFAVEAQMSERKLLDVALDDPHFRRFYSKLPEKHRRILQGQLELYIDPSPEKAQKNIDAARSTIVM